MATNSGESSLTLLWPGFRGDGSPRPSCRRSLSLQRADSPRNSFHVKLNSELSKAVSAEGSTVQESGMQIEVLGDQDNKDVELHKSLSLDQRSHSYGADSTPPSLLLSEFSTTSPKKLASLLDSQIAASRTELVRLEEIKKLQCECENLKSQLVTVTEKYNALAMRHIQYKAKRRAQVDELRSRLDAEMSSLQCQVDSLQSQLGVQRKMLIAEESFRERVEADYRQLQEEKRGLMLESRVREKERELSVLGRKIILLENNNSDLLAKVLQLKYTSSRHPVKNLVPKSNSVEGILTDLGTVTFGGSLKTSCDSGGGLQYGETCFQEIVEFVESRVVCSDQRDDDSIGSTLTSPPPSDDLGNVPPPPLYIHSTMTHNCGNTASILNTTPQQTCAGPLTKVYFWAKHFPRCEMVNIASRPLAVMSSGIVMNNGTVPVNTQKLFNRIIVVHEPNELKSIPQQKPVLGYTCDVLLFANTESVCDTTNQGKVKAIDTLKKNLELRLTVTVFYHPSASKEDITSAGEKFLLHLYGYKKSEMLELRYYRYNNIVYKQHLNQPAMQLHNTLTNYLEEKPNLVEDPGLPRERHVPNRLDNPGVAVPHKFFTPKEYFKHQYIDVCDTVNSESYKAGRHLNPILASGSREIQWVNKRLGTPTGLA
uniref:Uncharacterized protein n=1 Tax=Timema shepardi TaxID=629360 RepID=A0A7R9AZF3_TIMSH|nr:unnamed protein product [Timema shepardi]